MRYNPIIALPYLCVCALLEMVVRAEHGAGPNQVEIANYFGVHIPYGFHDPALTNVHYTNDPRKWGVIIRNNEINEFFHCYSIPLKESFLSINLFEDWSFVEKIEELLRSGAHIVCGYAMQKPKHGRIDHAPISIGHAVAILGVRPAGSMERDIIVYDPGPESAGDRRLPAHHLFSDIKARQDGLWIIQPG